VGFTPPFALTTLHFLSGSCSITPHGTTREQGEERHVFPQAPSRRFAPTLATSVCPQPHWLLTPAVNNASGAVLPPAGRAPYYCPTSQNDHFFSLRTGVSADAL